MNRATIRKLARDDANTVAKLNRVLEAENGDLRDKLAAAYAFIFTMTSCYDYVDTGTGEIVLAVGKYKRGDDEKESHGEDVYQQETVHPQGRGP